MQKTQLQKTHWKKLQNPDYLGSYEFQPGEDKVVTIGIVRQEIITSEGGKKEEKSVIHFKENIKPLIGNATNFKMLSKLLESPFVEDWAGRKITLYVDPNVRFGGEIVEGVRVRNKLPVEDKPVEVACSACNQIIKASGKFDAATLISTSRKKYGKPLCLDCGIKAKDASNESATAE